MVPATYRFFSLINAAIRRHQVFIIVPFSVEVLMILKLLRNENLIGSYQFTSSKKQFRVWLHYSDNRPVLKQILSISKPGRKVFASVQALHLFLKRVQQTSTPSPFLMIFRTKLGLITHHQVLRAFVGGQPLCIAYV